MESISIMDGLVLTIISMLVVFVVLAAIWGLVEMVSTLISRQEPTEESTKTSLTPIHQTVHHQMVPNKKYQQVAELMALVLASEDKPNKKFEIIESKRVK